LVNNFFGKSFRLGIYIRDWLKFRKKCFQLCLGVKKCVGDKKKPELGHFTHKKVPQYYRGDFWHILIDVPGGFLMIFLDKQH
jgi:hypothetical protein